MTHDSQRSLSRFTLENLKLRRLEDEGEKYEVTPEVPVDDAEITESCDPTILNMCDISQSKHNRDASKSALTYWRQEESMAKLQGETAKRSQQYQNLETPGMGLELECLTTFMSANHTKRILNNFANNKTDTHQPNLSQ
jgi:hypothetical protein